MVKFPAAGFSGYKECCEANKEASVKKNKKKNTPHRTHQKSLDVLLKPKMPFNSFFVHASHLHNHVYFNVSHIRAAASSCTDGCMHVLQREAHSPPALDRSVGVPPDCPHDIKALKQLWTHIHPGEGAVPYEINTGKNRLCGPKY